MAEHRAALVILLALLALAVLLAVSGKPRVDHAKQDRVRQAPPLAPLVAESALGELPVPGFEDLVVAAPLGAREPRPIAIVLHDGDATSHCASFRALARPEPFILCPRIQDNTKHTEQQLRAGLRALKFKFRAHVAKQPTVLVGFGRAADQAALLARQEPAFFSRLVLIDGGHEAWTASAAGAFKHRGGQRILFLCSTPSCSAVAERKIAITRSLDLSSELVSVPADERGSADALTRDALAARYSWLTAEVAPAPRVPNPREKQDIEP